MSSKYYSPPSTLAPLTTARSSYFNNEFSISMQTAFESLSVGVAGDMVKTLMHATLSLTAMVATALQMAGRLVTLDVTGLILQPSAVPYGKFRGTWVTTTNYNQGDTVTDSSSQFGLLYALKAFTSGASASADVAAGNLATIANIHLTRLPLPATVLTSAPSSSFILANNAYVMVSASIGGDVSFILPQSSTIGDCITISINPVFTNNVFVNANGSPINGVTTPQKIYSGGILHGARFYWVGGSIGWLLFRSY